MFFAIAGHIIPSLDICLCCLFVLILIYINTYIHMLFYCFIYIVIIHIYIYILAGYSRFVSCKHHHIDESNDAQSENEMMYCICI